MIVVDSSALIAILEEEPDHQRLKTVLALAERRIVSAVSVYESGIVMLRRRGPDGPNDLRELIERSISRSHPSIARSVTRPCEPTSKGIDPKARLNLGDCVSYALATALGAPLLFKGNDFAATDIVPG